MNKVFNQILIPPSSTGVVIPLPTGVGQVRQDILSLDQTRPNPIFDPSVNQQTGITFNVGGVSYRKGQ